MSFGLTPQGFRIKRLTTIRTEIENELRANLGPGINTLPESVFGQIIGIYSERESLLWEQLQAIFNSQYPDFAIENQLDLVISLVGLSRRAATRSRVPGQLYFGTPGTIVPQGTQISVIGSPSLVFQSISEVTLVAGADEEQLISFSAVPDSGSFSLNFNGQITTDIDWDMVAADVEAALEALPLIGVGNVDVSGDYSAGFQIDFINELQKQPLVQFAEESNTLLDGATPVVIGFSTPQVGQVQGQVDMQAINIGPVAAPQRGLTVIETPVFGLDATINPVQAIVGRSRETDAQLRARREREIQISGAATVGAIFAKVSEVEDVEAVVVFENDTPLVDSEGRPPHTVEVVVLGGENQVLANVIFATVAAGIGTHGSVTENVQDSNGFSQTVRFSRPTVVEILLEWDLQVDNVLFPQDGEDLVKANSVAFINSLTIGQDIITLPDLMCALNGRPELAIGKVPGILRADIRISKKPTAPTTDDNIVIDVNEVARIETADITVALV